MPRYIDAELLESKYREGTDPQDPYSEIAYLLPEDVESIPTADVEPVRHGRWISNIAFFGENYFECSRCGYDIGDDIPKYIKKEFEYCPSCGAKMDGGERVEEQQAETDNNSETG